MFGDWEGQTQGGILGTEKREGVTRMQCLPLYSLLLALGNPTVDFLSLDIEGAEYQVLSTLPWDKVDIRALAVETQFAGDVLEGSRADIISLLTGLGYSHLGSLARDDIFVRLPADGRSPALSLQQLAKRPPGRECEYTGVPREQLAWHCPLNFPRYTHSTWWEQKTNNKNTVLDTFECCNFLFVHCIMG